MKKNLIILFAVFFASCSSYQFKVSKEAMSNGITNDKFYETFPHGGLNHAICVVFENTMNDTKFKIKELTFFTYLSEKKINSIGENNISEMFFLLNNAKHYYIEIGNVKHHIEDTTYRKYRYLVIKKHGDEILFTYTNDVKYEFTNYQREELFPLPL